MAHPELLEESVIALYNYSAEEDTELSFKKGDVFIRLRQDESSGWSQGIHNDKIGWFPTDFCELHTPQTANAAKTDEEHRRAAEAAARQKAEEEAKREAEMEAKRMAADEAAAARRRAEEEVQRKAAEQAAAATRRAEEEAQRKAVEEAAAATRRADEEAKVNAEALRLGSERNYVSTMDILSTSLPPPPQEPSTEEEVSPTPVGGGPAGGAPASTIRGRGSGIRGRGSGVRGAARGLATGSPRGGGRSVGSPRRTGATVLSPRKPLPIAPAGSFSSDKSNDAPNAAVVLALQTRCAELERRNRKMENELQHFKAMFMSHRQALSIVPGINALTVATDDYTAWKDAEVASGWLSKKGRNRKNWKRRYFVLKGPSLMYYAKPLDKTGLGVIDFDTIAIEEPAIREDSTRPCMALIVEGRKLLFMADTDEENLAWFLTFSAKNAELAYVKKMQLANKKIDIRLVRFFHNPFVTALHLDNVDLSLDAMGALNAVLRFHHTLKVLSMNRANVDDLAITNLVDALSRNKSLQTLKLAHNKLTAEGVATLLSALEKNDAIPLEELHLHGNAINDDSVRTLCMYWLARRGQTHTLRFDHSPDVGADAAKTLATSVVGAVFQFKYVNFSHCHIGDEGARAVARIVAARDCVEYVNLTEAGLTQDGMAAVIEAVAASGTVNTLRLGGNEGSAPLMGRVKRVCVENHSLKRLDIGTLSLDAAGLSALRMMAM